MISPDLADMAVPIDSVEPLDRNPRKGDVEAIVASLARFGQQAPIVVSTDGKILKGNHTHAAAISLGWTEIAVSRSDLSLDEARAFVLADNRTSDLARYDNLLLLDLLDEIRTADDSLLAAASYSYDDLERLQALNDEAGFTPPPDPDPEDTPLLSCPKCGYEW